MGRQRDVVERTRSLRSLEVSDLGVPTVSYHALAVPAHWPIASIYWRRGRAKPNGIWSAVPVRLRLAPSGPAADALAHAGVAARSMSRCAQSTSAHNAGLHTRPHASVS